VIATSTVSAAAADPPLAATTPRPGEERADPATNTLAHALASPRSASNAVSPPRRARRRLGLNSDGPPAASVRESVARGRPERQTARRMWGKGIGAPACGRCAHACSCGDQEGGRATCAEGNKEGAGSTLFNLSVSSQCTGHTVRRVGGGDMNKEPHKGARGRQSAHDRAPTHRLPVSPKRQSHSGHLNGRTPSCTVRSCFLEGTERLSEEVSISAAIGRSETPGWQSRNGQNRPAGALLTLLTVRQSTQQPLKRRGLNASVARGRPCAPSFAPPPVRMAAVLCHAAVNHAPRSDTGATVVAGLGDQLATSRSVTRHKRYRGKNPHTCNLQPVIPALCEGPTRHSATEDEPTPVSGGRIKGERMREATTSQSQSSVCVHQQSSS